MFKVDEITGDITLRQGDDGEYNLVNLVADKPYEYCFAITDKNRNKIYEIKTGTIADLTEVTFKISVSATDLLIVPKGKEEQEYYFAIKRCGRRINALTGEFEPDGTEDTMPINNNDVKYVNTITVLPKMAEGD